jgi:hypothetical protein
MTSTTDGSVLARSKSPSRTRRVGHGRDAFAAATSFDPRTLTTRKMYFRIHPRRMQAWSEDDELEGRELMRYGRWLEA